MALRFNRLCEVPRCAAYCREDRRICREHYFVIPPEWRFLLFGTQEQIGKAIAMADELDEGQIRGNQKRW